jgi:hypothetical protein
MLRRVFVHFAALHFMHKNRSAVCAAEQGVIRTMSPNSISDLELFVEKSEWLESSNFYKTVQRDTTGTTYSYSKTDYWDTQIKSRLFVQNFL